MASWQEADSPLLDALAREQFESGFMQSSAWAEFKRAEGYSVHRLLCCHDGVPIGGASIFEYPGDGFLLCPEGPVLPWQDEELCRKALRALTQWAGERSALGLRIEPHLPPPGPGFMRNWSSAPVDLTPKHTLFVDIEGPEEDRLGRMQAKARYNLKLAQRHGVQVRAGTSLDDLQVLHRLLEQTANRNDFYSEPPGFFINLATSLFPVGVAEVLVGSWQGEDLAAILVVYFGRRATYLYGGSSEQSRQVMPNYLLHWEAMRRARTHGCREYDLYGYDPFGDPEHLYAGISRFKLGWGGTRQDWMGARDYVFYDTLAERIVQRLSLGQSPHNEP